MTEALAAPGGADGSDDQDLLYRDGEWTRIPSPITGEGDWDKAVSEAGYKEFFGSGDPDSNYVTIHLYRGPSNYLIDLSSNVSSEVVYAATLPDAMDLLAKWMPVVSSASLGCLLTELDQGQSALGQLIAKAVEKQ
ncbi:hypothetical protein [Streptomyces sp. NBC_00878]|uniref:hypothetical protein n=1 Tax=Streptomyces sp. NBC_00878 TaxID=2975854 RepID=UPI00224DCB1A|nr:hypothetical protein [Streptomyces sp. NBC_00878]MCX4907063.1 hypothetical protein [Streptomyces sp. NBC_00878]